MSNQNVPSPDDMIASFPNPTLPRIEEETQYEQLVELRNSLKENYASVSTRRGGGSYGYLGAIVSPTLYFTLEPLNAFIIPPNPGLPPTIVHGTTAITSGNTLREWNEASREFKEWQNLEKAGKKQLTEAIPSGMLNGLKCHHRGFNRVTVRMMLDHVFQNFGQIDHQDLIANRARLIEEWDSNQPFSTLVQRVQAVQEYANDGGRPIGENDVIDAIYTVIFNTGMFYEDCEKWNDKALPRRHGRTSNSSSPKHNARSEDARKPPAKQEATMVQMQW